jgi:hypothetical protein
MAGGRDRTQSLLRVAECLDGSRIEIDAVERVWHVAECLGEQVLRMLCFCRWVVVRREPVVSGQFGLGRVAIVGRFDVAERGRRAGLPLCERPSAPEQ